MNHGVNRTRIDDLDDHMLTQILLRLPNCATVLACSPVNKRWCSLISDLNFSVQFVDHKKKTTTFSKGSDSDHEDDQPRWNLITTTKSWKLPLTTEFIFGSTKVSLNYLPCNTCTTRATFKDLLLCSDYKTYKGRGRVYYITNLLTKQWIALPPCPSSDKHKWETMTNVAFICQPPYNNTQHYNKFRVVKASPLRMDYTFDLVVYCSEIGEWKEIKLRVPNEVGPLRLVNEETETVVCNGIIYFKSGLCNLCLVAFNPFDVNASSCDMTHEARVMPPLPDFGYLKESSGQLLVVHTPQNGLWYRKDGTTITLQMVVWKLDLNQAPLVWETTFQGLCKGELPHYSRLECRIFAESINVHPYNHKLIYMYLIPGKQVVLCDTRTGCITSSKSLLYYGKTFHRLPWWPTSVSALATTTTRV
ncbi:uncharacterized protein LOC141632774 [Silene latifolia]|uniref:uncharacterized protein LOC141632774 n=1 Tax=Silene latifolia TaxID=37657 RepID=UPI003D771BD1